MAGIGATSLEAVLVDGTTYYVALNETEVKITDESTGDEADYTGYARVACSSWNTSTVSGQVRVSNGATVAFAAYAGEKVQYRYWSIWDASSGGNLIACGPMRFAGEVTQIIPNTSDVIEFAAGDLYIYAEDD